MSDELFLRVIAPGPWQGREIGLSPGSSYSVGSGEECALCLAGAPGVEAVHCVIRPLKGGGFGIKDLGGPSGTLVNGQPIQVARLNPEDRVRIGQVELLCLEPGAAAPQPAPEAPRPVRKTPPRPRDLERVGSTIKGYRLIEYLGRGSMGTVYRAEQESLQRQVALKLLRRELTRDPEFVERFVSEARAAGRFNHPNVVHVYDVGQEGDTYYYSMELMDQGSLEEELSVQGRLTLVEALKVVRDAAKGLRYAEEVGVVHRDIKPDNLMRNAQGTTKIVDLGLAATGDETPVENGPRKRIFGTPHFIAPEQARGGQVDCRSDLYSLGCTFYRLVTGRTPFGGSTVKEILRAQLTEEPEPAHKVEPSVPESVGRIIARLMAKDPAERFQNAGELLHELERLSGKGRTARRLLPIGALILVAAAGLFFALRGNGPENGGGAGPDPQMVEQLEEAERARRESEARTALLEAQALPENSEQVALLKKVTADFTGTSAGAEAASRAAELEALLAGRAAQAEARRERLSALLAALAQAREDAATHRDGPTLFEALGALPHLAELNAEPSVADALAEARGQARALVEATLAEFLREAEAALEAGDPSAAESALARLETGLDQGGLPAPLSAELSARFRPEVERCTRALEALTSRLTAAESGRDRQLFMDTFFRKKDSVAEALRSLDPGKALQAARSLGDRLKTLPFQELLATKVSLLERAERAWSTFLKEAATPGSSPLARAGSSWQVEGVAPGPVLTLVEQAEGARRQELRLDGKILSREPELIAALLDPERRKATSPEAHADAAILAAFLGPIPLAAAARQQMATIRSKDPGSGLSPTPPTFDLRLLELAERAASRSGPALAGGARTQVEREIRAARVLVQALIAFSQSRNLEAAECLERIFAEEADSLVYGLLGAGPALLPEQARSQRREEE